MLLVVTAPAVGPTPEFRPDFFIAVSTLVPILLIAVTLQTGLIEYMARLFVGAVKGINELVAGPPNPFGDLFNLRTARAALVLAIGAFLTTVYGVGIAAELESLAALKNRKPGGERGMYDTCRLLLMLVAAATALNLLVSISARVRERRSLDG